MADPTGWDVATRVLAFVGAILGVVNTAMAFIRGGPRFKVDCSVTGAEPPVLNIEVLNRGQFDISVAEFSLTAIHPNGGPARYTRFEVAEAALLPQRIAAGEAASFTCAISSIQQAVDGGCNVVRVRTADKRARHSSPCWALADRAARS